MAETNFIPEDWQDKLKGEFSKDYFIKLQTSLHDEYAKKDININPERSLIFRALELTPFEKVKVVIVGQDPYPGKNQAQGLAFSIPLETKIPPSLENIYKVLQSDLGCAPSAHGCLESWARQGVLLLNSILTVRQGETLSHKNKGWETFTDAIIQELNKREKPVVFILWGDLAQSKSHRIKFNDQHLILTDSHPTVIYDEKLTDFFGSKPFSDANDFLEKYKLGPIDWKLPYINNDWQEILKDEFSKPYFTLLQERLDEQYANEDININPERRFIFRALELTPFKDVKVVIVGHDPCPTIRQTGVAFSVPFGTPTWQIPKAITVMKKELKKYFKKNKDKKEYKLIEHGCTESWARKGVLLLNSILTIRMGAKEASSHQNLGWKTFTNAIIEKLNEREQPVYFILLGDIAEEKKVLIKNDRHGVLRTRHPLTESYETQFIDPSIPLFSESKLFSKANEWLTSKNITPINWQLPQSEEPQEEVDALANRLGAI